MKKLIMRKINPSLKISNKKEATRNMRKLKLNRMITNIMSIIMKAAIKK